MDLRVLGAHSLESEDTRLTSFLIDGKLALDAGSLTRSLTLEEQGRIQAVALTHHHFDHVRDLLTLGLGTRDNGVTVEVWAPGETLDYVARYLMDGALYPRFTEAPTPEAPKYRMCRAKPYVPFSVLGYTFVALPVPHGAPAVAYQVTAPDNRRLFLSGDTGPGLRACWDHADPHLMVIEVSFPSRMEAKAREVGHLTPTLLREELEEYLRTKDALPPVLAVHRNPHYEEEILRELADVAANLGAVITPAHEGMVLRV